MSKIAEVISMAQDKDGMLRRALERIIQLYTDKSHFVYELLQNAEDAQAQCIRFVQYSDRLEVWHDGKPFTQQNLQGLCDIGLSDKTENYNQIGEFGVGFKSVFGICDTVKLYSDPSHYRIPVEDATPFAVEITDFVNISDIAGVPLDSAYTTRFVFPYAVGRSYSGFDDINKLRSALAKKLQNLGVTTLLFMKNLEWIEYKIETDSEPIEGEYLLDKQIINDHCELVSALGESGNDSEENEASYLMFSRKLSNSPRTVDIAFPVKRTESGEYECVKTKEPYVSVYFPTETESKLSFIVQGPYRTTPNRSSIPADDKENQALAKETAVLLRESLLELRANGKLNMSFVKVLPLTERSFDSYKLFSPLYDTVKALFSTVSILPCKNGGYTLAKNAKIARQEKLVSLLDDDLLSSLINDGNKYQWLPTYLTETNREYEHVYRYLTSELKVGVIRPEDTRGFIIKNTKFLPSRNNDWLVAFYSILENVSNAFVKSGTNMLTAPIVKTSSGTFVSPYRKTENGQFIANVFVPTSGVYSKDIYFVDKNLYDRCRHFFDDILGLGKPNEYELIVKDIRSRYEKNFAIDEETHIQDVKNILRYLKYPNYHDDISALVKSVFWVRCTDKKSRNTSECRVFLPISTDGLRIQEYFRNINCSVYFVDADFYTNNGISFEDLCSIGVLNSILIGENITSGTYFTGSRGNQPSWWTAGDFRWKLSVENIKDALKYISDHPTEKDSWFKSQTIMKVLFLHESMLVGQVMIGGNTPNLENEPCDLIKIIRGEQHRLWNGKWLFTDSNELVSPKTISKHDINTALYGKLKDGSVVYDLLGFKKTDADEVEELKQQIPKDRLNAFFEKELMLRFGITSEDVAKTFGIMQSRSYNDDVDETEVFEFPIGRIKDWEVLRKHAAEALVYANPVKYEMAIRSRRVSNHPRETRAYLLNTYRCNGVYRYACQMCHEATANIEAVEIFPNPETELDPINLCLCPNCAAKYRQYRSNTRMMDGFRKAIMDKQEYEVCNGDQVIIQVGDSEIWFAQTHFAEIQELLRLTDAVKENTSKSESECDRECKRSADNAVQFADADEKPGTDVYAAYIGKSVSRKDGFRGVVTGLEPTKDDCYLIVKILSGATNGKDTTSISIEFILQHRGVYSFE